jgi:hypothetical protein
MVIPLGTGYLDAMVPEPIPNAPEKVTFDWTEAVLWVVDPDP